MKMIDKKLIGEANRLAILKWLHRFGWLTSRMISELVWNDIPSKLAMAQRTLANMQKAKLVVKRELPIGGNVHLLGARGADLLKSEYGISAESGSRLKLGNPLHRSASNWYLIRELAKGNEVKTEHEIQTGKVPISKRYGKVADGFVLTKQGVVWLEVENAWKNRGRRAEILKFCADYLGDPEVQECLWGEWHLFRVEVLAITAESGEAMVRTILEAYQSGFINELALHDLWLIYAPMSSGLIYPDEDRIKSYQAWYGLIEPFSPSCSVGD